MKEQIFDFKTAAEEAVRQAVKDVLTEQLEALQQSCDISRQAKDGRAMTWQQALALKQGVYRINQRIVRCKDCKHNQLPATSGNANCEIFYGMNDRNGFCHMAERRTDE